MHSTIIATASSLPSSAVESSDLIKKINKTNKFNLDTNIIEKVTGIRSRYITSKDEHPSTLAAAAARSAVEKCGLDMSEIDTLIFASGSPDMITPATANVVCDLLGTSANCFDVSNACNSFLNGMQVASLLVESNSARNVVVCTGEVGTKVIRYKFTDTYTFPNHFTGLTLGDGGAALVVSGSRSKGFHFFNNKSYPQFWSDSGIFAGGSRNLRKVSPGFFQADPAKLKKNSKLVSTEYADFVKNFLNENSLNIKDFRFVLTHQTTAKYRNLFYETLGCDYSQTVPTVETRGNLISASLPTQLDMVWGEIESHDKILFVSIGGGISAGLAVWSKT